MMEKRHIYFAGEWEMEKTMENEIKYERIRLEELERKMERVREKLFNENNSLGRIRQYKARVISIKKEIKKVECRIDCLEEYLCENYC